MALIPPLSIALAFALFGVACCFAISMAIAGRGLRLSWSVVSLPLAFAWLVLGEKLTWNYAVSFALILLAVYFATAFKPNGPTH